MADATSRHLRTPRQEPARSAVPPRAAADRDWRQGLHAAWHRPYTIGRRAWDAVMGDDITTNASSFAYHTLFAIPPLIILSVTIAALINRVTAVDVTGNLRELIRDHAPGETRQLLNAMVADAIARVGSGGASLGIVVTTLVALRSGSNAAGALIRAFNRAYEVEETRPFIQRTRLKLLLTLLGTLSLNLAFALIVFGHRIGEKAAAVFGFGATFDRVWRVLRWPTAVAAIALLLAVLYYVGPNVELSFRWISPGSALATTLWVATGAAFGVYLRLAHPGTAYGAVGSVVVLLFFLYVTGFIFLLGAKLNAALGKRYDPLIIEDLATGATAKPGARASARRRFRRWLAGGAVRRPPQETTGAAPR
ncbi:MAG TPA: YihY/virulence factor BrkB family protein [Thermomicrobiales bacterium]|jgi:membrane protein